MSVLLRMKGRKEGVVQVFSGGRWSIPTSVMMYSGPGVKAECSFIPPTL